MKCDNNDDALTSGKFARGAFNELNRFQCQFKLALRKRLMPRVQKAVYICLQSLIENIGFSVFANLANLRSFNPMYCNTLYCITGKRHIKLSCNEIRTVLSLVAKIRTLNSSIWNADSLCLIKQTKKIEGFCSFFIFLFRPLKKKVKYFFWPKIYLLSAPCFLQ